MLGPHGGIILSKEELAKQIDSAVHPGIQSSVPLRRIYGMAECLLDAHTAKFTDYIDRVLGNMAVFADVFARQGNMMVTGGSDTHLMVVDTLNTLGITGKDAEASLENVGILTNRQVIPNDTQRPYVASGLRLGASWITGRGYSQDETRIIAEDVIATLQEPQNERLQAEVRARMDSILATEHPLDVWGGSY
jgi:glycine hydroxymethyltransferase